MNETSADSQAGSHARSEPPGTYRKPFAGARVKSWTVISAILIIVALLAAGSAMYLAYRDRNIVISTRATLDNLVESSETLGASLEELEGRLEQLQEAQEVTSRSLLDLSGKLPGSNEDWALAEIEFLLILATHHLQLEHNPEAALAAMQAADLRLRGLGNPALDPVHEQLARDIGRLQEAGGTDTKALALTLGKLANRVNSLPLAADTDTRGTTATEPGAAQAPAGAWEGILDTIWRELHNLVIIRHDTGMQQAIMLPEQKNFIYQNLRLELESARLSLLRRDTENLHAAAAFAQKLLADYFADNDPGVKNTMATLQKLSSINLDPPLPDISSSLESLRAYMREQATELPQEEGNTGPAT